MEEKIKSRQSRNNKWKLYFSVFAVVISITAFVLALNLKSITVLQKNEIPIILSVSNRSAINVSKAQDDLNFGTIQKAEFAQRNLSISNGYDFKTAFEFEVVGDIAPLMGYYPNVIILEPKETREITFMTKIIEDEELGVYSGKVIVRIRKVPEGKFPSEDTNNINSTIVLENTSE